MKKMRCIQIVFFILGLFLVVTCDAFARNDVDALASFHEVIYEDPHHVLSNWNALDSDPCNWFGVSCSMAQDYVIQINVSGSSLKGFFPHKLCLLTSLQELILHGNHLTGILPKEIGTLKHLKVLDLGMNQLSGTIPPEIGNLISIWKIDLQSNRLTGRVPAELGNLKLLEELRLDGNELGGWLPDSISVVNANWSYVFCRSSQLKVADFSFNYFVGSIPKCLAYLPSSSFQWNCLRDTPMQRPTRQCGSRPSPPAKSHPGGKRKHRPHRRHRPHRPLEEDQPKSQATSKPAWLLAMELVVSSKDFWILALEILTGVVVGRLLLAAGRLLLVAGRKFLVAFLAAAQKCKSMLSLIIPYSGMLKDVRVFSRQELEVACEDFRNVIESSSDTLVVYKGTMKGGAEIAVMPINKEQWTDYLEFHFQQEVVELARLTHENIGRLIGFCTESSPFTRMVVFEYAFVGTLYDHLYDGERCQLSWTQRMKIVVGIAKGLKYLHTEIEPPFTISNLNSNAVYLTEDFLPKITDFKRWKKILSRSEKNTGAVRQEGAILPNSLEGNIYGFGVLLLEIVSGRPLYCKEKGCLVYWAKELLERPDGFFDLVDPKLEDIEWLNLTLIWEVANLCIYQSPTKPASMQELSNMLEENIGTPVSSESQSNLKFGFQQLKNRGRSSNY